MWSYSVEDVDYIEHERLKVNKEADERSTCQHKQRQSHVLKHKTNEELLNKDKTNKTGQDPDIIQQFYGHFP